MRYPGDTMEKATMSKIDLQQLKRLKDEGRDVKEIAETFGVSLTAVYKAAKKTVRLAVPASIERLTQKQKKFVQLKSTGISGTEAALQAFDCQTRKSAKEIASQLMAKPEIKAAMSDWLEWHGCGRGRRAERLVEFVENPDPAVAMPALKIAMQAGNDFPSDAESSGAEIKVTLYFPERLTPEQSREIYGEPVIDIPPSEDHHLLPSPGDEDMD